MGEIQIIWTKKANKSLILILDFYLEQNGNFDYCEKLLSEIIQQTNYIKVNPNIGKETNHFLIRELVFGRNSIFYVFSQTYINVLLIWDNRQDPEKLLELLNKL